MTTRRARPRSLTSEPARWPPCPRCGLSYQRARQWPEGRVCHYCATAALRRTGRCATCHHDGVLPGLDPKNNEPICVSCSGIPVDVTCRRCGTEAPLGRSNACWRCLLTTKTRTLFAGPDGDIPSELAPLAEAITSMPNANSGHTWLSNPAVGTVLRCLAAGDLALDHTALDELPASRTIEHLRGLLVASGCLPACDPHLAGYERWLAAKLDTIDDLTHRQIVDRFARWHLLRQLRDRAARGPITDGAFLNAKQTTTVTTGFLSWLTDRTSSLERLSQHDIDAWFAGGLSTRKHAVRFLYWAREQRLIPDLEVPVPRTNHTRIVGTRERLALLRRMLTDDDGPTSARLAGTLVLLFGVSLDQLTKLRLEHIHETDDGIRMQLGNHPVLLPEPVADLLRRHLGDARYTRSTAANASSPWLFPGTRPGRPMHLNTLSIMLERIDIPARAARAGTWIDLVRDGPTAVLADALGLSPTAVMRYLERAGSDYLTYPATKNSDR